jgi:hypothetical protein
LPANGDEDRAGCAPRIPVGACSVSNVALAPVRAVAVARAVADVWPASARCTAALMVRPGDGAEVVSAAAAALAETLVTERVATCVCGRMDPLAVTVTRWREEPNDC